MNQACRKAAAIWGEHACRLTQVNTTLQEWKVTLSVIGTRCQRLAASKLPPFAPFGSVATTTFDNRC